MLQGAYTIQEVINRLGLDNTPAGALIPLAFAGAAGLWCLGHRRADPWRHAALLAFVSVLRTYHERYDFILLLIPARFLWQKLWRREQLQLADFVELADYAEIALALTDMIYLTDHKVAWLLRWYGRAALAGLFVHAALQGRANALENRSAAAS